MGLIPMKKTLLISIASLFVFTGCSTIALNDNQKTNLGMTGGIADRCYKEGFITLDEYNSLLAVYMNAVDRNKGGYQDISASFDRYSRSTDQLNHQICRTDIPTNFAHIRQYLNRNTVSVTDVMAGLNTLSQSYAVHSQQMLRQSSRNMYYPQPTINNNSRKRRTLNAQQIGDTTYFSDGTSWTRSGDNLIHSDGITSYISGGYIYNPDGSKCYVSGGTLICD